MNEGRVLGGGRLEGRGEFQGMDWRKRASRILRVFKEKEEEKERD